MLATPNSIARRSTSAWFGRTSAACSIWSRSASIWLRKAIGMTTWTVIVALWFTLLPVAAIAIGVAMLLGAAARRARAARGALAGISCDLSSAATSRAALFRVAFVRIVFSVVAGVTLALCAAALDAALGLPVGADEVSSPLE